MPLLIVVLGIILLFFLIAVFKLNAFISFIIVCLLVGILQGMELEAVIQSMQNGIGNTLGFLVLILGLGAMLGKLVAESGAAQRITSWLVERFGRKYIQWAVVIAGFIVGIPMFYTVGFVILIPLVFTVAAATNLPLIYVGLPMLTSLSVTHGFLPPHPAPTAIAAMFGASIGKTLLYGTVVAIPAIVIAGPLFARTIKKIKASPLPEFYNPVVLEENEMPKMGVSVFTALLPVLLIGLSTVLDYALPMDFPMRKLLVFIGNPVMAMLISVLVAIYTLGLARGIPPLVLGWLIATILRVSIGSATVAGLTAAGIVLPLVSGTSVQPELMVLAIGSGSLMLSHVNDGGFWLFKEYFNLSVKETLSTWTVMETLVGVIGITGVLIMNQIL